MKLAKRVATIKPSVTLELISRAKKIKDAGEWVINFGGGEPDFDTPSHIKDAAIEAIRNGFTKYTPASGIDELKKLISEKFRKDNNIHYELNQVVISNGAKHSLFNIFQVLCEEGDEIIIPSPYWISYPEIVRLCGGNPKFVKTNQFDNFKLTEKLLSSAITDKTRAIILNTPSNPIGSIYTENELEKIASIAIANNIYVISDEIYEKIIYDNNRHISIASLGKEIYDLTVTVNGVSKSYSMTGWRIGYLGAPVQIAKAISNHQSHSTSNPSSISQKATVAALIDDQFCVSKMVDEFKTRRDYMLERLSNIKNISFVKPEGAFYIFCDISAFNLSASSFAEKMLEKEKVVVIPGEDFGLSTHIRLSFVTGMDNIKEGMDRIGKFVSELKN